MVHFLTWLCVDKSSFLNLFYSPKSLKHLLIENAKLLRLCRKISATIEYFTWKKLINPEYYFDKNRKYLNLYFLSIEEIKSYRDLALAYKMGI
jgi:hypothetical protein